MDKEKIIKRLESFGYKYSKDEDDFAIDFSIEKVRSHISNVTNCAEIPDGLIAIGIDIVCAEFLKLKKGLGWLTDADFEMIAASIKLGDASVEFPSNYTPEQKFDASINYLLTAYEEDFLRYRKLVW